MKEALKRIGIVISSFALMCVILFGISTISRAGVIFNTTTLADMEEDIENLSDNDNVIVKYDKSGCDCRERIEEITMTKSDYYEFKMKYEIISVRPEKNKEAKEDDKTLFGLSGDLVETVGANQESEKPQESAPQEEKKDDNQEVTAAEAPAAAEDNHVPKNVEMKMLGTTTEDDGKKYLEVEISWDADESVNYNEVLPLLLDGQGGAYIIPLADGQTVGNAPDVPDRVRYKTENGRNILKPRIPVIGNDEEQIVKSDQGMYALGLKEGDSAAIIMSAVTDPNTWTESDYSNPVEFTFTQENVDNQATFKEVA